MNRKDFEYAFGTATAKWHVEEHGLRAWVVSPPLLQGTSIEDIKKCHTFYEAIVAVYSPKGLQETVNYCIKNILPLSPRKDVMLLVSAALHHGSKSLTVELIKQYNISADERAEMISMIPRLNPRHSIWVQDIEGTYTIGDKSVSYTIKFGTPIQCTFGVGTKSADDIRAAIPFITEMDRLCQGQALPVPSIIPASIIKLVNTWLRLVTPAPTVTPADTTRTFTIKCDDGVQRSIVINKVIKEWSFSGEKNWQGTDYMRIHNIIMKIMEAMFKGENPEPLIKQDLSTWCNIAIWMGKDDIATKLSWREFVVPGTNGELKTCLFSRSAHLYKAINDVVINHTCTEICEGRWRPALEYWVLSDGKCECFNSKTGNKLCFAVCVWMHGESYAYESFSRQEIDELIADRKRW